MVLVLVSSLLLSAGALDAAPRPEPVTPRSVFAQADSDGDGKVTPAEHRVSVKNWFQELDENHDMRVVARESEAAARERFRLMDDDADGTVALEEYVSHYCGIQRADPAVIKDQKYPRLAGFKVQDLNLDGIIDLSECAVFRTRAFRAMDRDADGKLSDAEAKNGSAKQLAEADADGDGAVTDKEWLRSFVSPEPTAKRKKPKASVSPDAPGLSP